MNQHKIIAQFRIIHHDNERNELYTKGLKTNLKDVINAIERLPQYVDAYYYGEKIAAILLVQLSVTIAILLVLICYLFD